MTQVLEPMPTRQLTIEPTTTIPVAATGTIRGQGVRFFVIGSGGTGLQLGLYAVAAGVVGAQIASIASWLISTLVTNATHRALTFNVRGTASNRSDQIAALMTCLVGLLVTSVVLAQLPDADGISGLIAILVVNTVVGAGRFFGMRWWLGDSGRRVAHQVSAAAHAMRANWHGTRGLTGLHH
ncbi:putative flippase GtrA [Nakamurella sp. UYEF19]|uniref:GtrA family protein n=1 Tax=Nakamurella sp. UYEF19 TaxID=1756392 RepID=UPI00339ACF93